MYRSNGLLNVQAMDYCNATIKTCRDQYELKNFNYVNSKGNPVEKCCCEFDIAIEPKPNPPPVYAPICYFSPNSKKVATWSIVRHADDLVCPNNYTLYTVKLPTSSGTERDFSCCNNTAVPVPPIKPSEENFEKYLNFQ